MKRLLCIALLYFSQSASAQLFKTDTFTYSINLDLSQNVYLQTLPVDLLKGYCAGKWNAYYPKYEYSQCLWDEYLEHYQRNNFNEQNLFCLDDYCGQPYFQNLYDNFKRKITYREIYYFDAQHSIVKRELLSIQVHYSYQEYSGMWKHIPSLIFWMKETNLYPDDLLIYNKSIRAQAWTLQKEFSNPGFMKNENPIKSNKQKENKFQDLQEN